MAFFDLKALILAQIAIDISIVIVFIFLIRRFRHFNRSQALFKAVKNFESMLNDADRMSGQFKEQLEEKNELIKRLNNQLDKKVMSLHVMLNRAESLLASYEQTRDTHDSPVSSNEKDREILKLANEGHDQESIAGTLSIPRGEVKLVLDLHEKLSRLPGKKGAS